MDGNAQTGDSREYVDGLRLGLRLLTDRIATEAEVFDPSLESIVAAETSISTFDDGPRIRGYNLGDLMRRASFAEVAYLLLERELPDGERLADFQSVLSESTDVPEAITGLVSSLPLHVPPLEVMRTALSSLAHFDPQPDERDRTALVNQTLRLLAKLPRVLAARIADAKVRPMVEPDCDLSFTAYFLECLIGREVSPEAEGAFDAALTVVAEQGLDASTLAARAAVSTGGDLYTAVTAALSVWSGPLHGGPRAEVIKWVRQAIEFGPEDYLQNEFSQGHSFAGFDVRLLVVGDQRAAWLKPYCRELADRSGQSRFEDAAALLEKRIAEETGAGPTLDWSLSRLLMYLGVDANFFKAVAAIARIVGWAAHADEQADRNQLLRPRGRYVGPPSRPFRPLEERE